jgi:hypothetical protein
MARDSGGPSEAGASFAAACGFEPTPGRCQILPDAKGKIAGVLFGIELADACVRDLFLPGQLATSLPCGVYRFANRPHDALATLSGLLSGYRFQRYKTMPDSFSIRRRYRPASGPWRATRTQTANGAIGAVKCFSLMLGSSGLEFEAVGLPALYCRIRSIWRFAASSRSEIIFSISMSWVEVAPANRRWSTRTCAQG